MSRKKTYITDSDKLQHLISIWGQYKSTANDCLTLVETANQELQAYLTNHTFHCLTQTMDILEDSEERTDV